MPTIRFNVNGTPASVDVDADMPLLWVLRDVLGLTGTKYGCGIAQCGACTVHVDGEAVRSCSLATGDCQGRSITTIEGLAPKHNHPLQLAWVEHDVPQCGYCQPGMIMTGAALLAKDPRLTPSEIESSMNEHICRCGTYNRIRTAVATAVSQSAGGKR